MIVTTTDCIPGEEASGVLCVVYSNTVQAKHVGKDIMAGFKRLVGREISGYSEMLMESRDRATERMVESAQGMQADAIVNISLYNQCSHARDVRSIGMWYCRYVERSFEFWAEGMKK